VEDEFEWPLCGVAERNSRFSKGGASRRARCVSRVDRVLARCGWRHRVRLIKREQRLREPLVQVLKERLPVLGALECVVRDDEAVVRLPRVQAETSLLAPPQHELPVVSLETLPEAAFEHQPFGELGVSAAPQSPSPATRGRSSV